MRAAVIRSVSAVGVGVGAVISVLEAIHDRAVLPTAAFLTSVSAALLIVWLPRTPWLRLFVGMICAAAVVLGLGNLAEGGPFVPTRLAALAIVLLNLGLLVPALPEIKALIYETKTRSVIRHQEFHAAQIADELHDEVLQALALTSRRLDALAGATDEPRVTGELADAVQVLNEQAVVLRGIVSTLHPVLLRHMGLVDGTRALARQVANANGLIIAVDSDSEAREERAVDAEIATAAYRVVHEALMNVVKHAEASSVRVGLHCQRGQLVVTVSDDGCGLSEPSKGGYGIESMRWRCEAYSGSFQIGSAAGDGTRLRATFPLTAKGKDVSRRLAPA